MSNLQNMKTLELIKKYIYFTYLLLKYKLMTIFEDQIVKCVVFYKWVVGDV